MRREAKKYLWDIQHAIALVQDFTDGKTFTDYETDEMLRSAVERQFEIIGEAITRLAKVDPSIVTRISEYKQIIAFRNALVHGYSVVNNRTVWDVVDSDLPRLSREIHALMKQE